MENVGFLKDKPKALHAFRVVTKGHIYLLAAKSAALKKDWMKVGCLTSTSEPLARCSLSPNPWPRRLEEVLHASVADDSVHAVVGSTMKVVNEGGMHPFISRIMLFAMISSRLKHHAIGHLHAV